MSTSRWVELPDHVTELPGGLPQGFRAAGVACGLKPSGARDLGLLVSDSRSTVSAARFTRSGVLAAPVLLTQERCRPAGIRAVVANAGNANAATGRRGLEDAARMQRAGAAAAGVPEDCVAVASTGVIGVPLDIDKVIARDRGGAARAGARRRRRVRRGDPHDRRDRQARGARGPAPVRGRPAVRPGQGSGHDLALVRDDAVLRRDRRRARAGDRRPAARRVRQALVRPHLGRRPALDQRHGDPDGVRRRRACGSSPSPRTSCASARRSTTCCAGSRCRWCATARAPTGSAVWWCTAATRRPSCARRARWRTRRS